MLQGWHVRLGKKGGGATQKKKERVMWVPTSAGTSSTSQGNNLEGDKERKVGRVERPV